MNTHDPHYLLPHLDDVRLAVAVLGSVDFAAIHEWIDRTEECAPHMSPHLWADDGPRRILEYRLLVDAAKHLADTADGIRYARMVAP